MNLIEKLGGYEKAKEALIAEQRSKNIDPVIYINGDEVLIDAIDDALLDYRRQHNIFEVGDLVTYKANFKGMWREGFGKITEIDEDLEAVNINENIGVAISEIEHANDAEIEAGKRLGVS